MANPRNKTSSYTPGIKLSGDSVEIYVQKELKRLGDLLYSKVTSLEDRISEIVINSDYTSMQKKIDEMQTTIDSIILTNQDQDAAIDKLRPLSSESKIAQLELRLGKVEKTSITHTDTLAGLRKELDTLRDIY